MVVSRPMSRLICGDVGFGKTEIAIRAAFRAVLNGRLVLVLAPTTILAQQLENSFKNRLRSFGTYVNSVSRFKTKKGGKAGRWRVKPRTWGDGEGRYRYWARKLGRTPNLVEYFPTEEEKKGKFRRGAKASGMSFKIKKEIFF